MQTRTVTIQHRDGMHTRPASVFVREAGKFACEVQLSHDGVTVNGKSIMGILMLALAPGTAVEITTEGVDEVVAVDRLAAVLSGSFS